MKQSLRLLTVVFAMAAVTPTALAQITSTSTSNGGSGGSGGAAAGGTATGGTASNTTSGVSNASGGQGGSSTGGTSSATGGSVGTVSTGGSNAQLGDITVNYTTPTTTVPMGKAGLGVGVDPVTGAIITDSTVTYQGSYKLKNTPDVSVGGPASGPCNGFSGGVGVSMAGFAIGANTSTVDEACSARETARIAAMIGRMDVANAILDNLPIVVAAMKAKAAREALALPAKSSEAPATSAPAHWLPAPVPVQTQEQKEAALKEQQRLAQEALQRQATMAKLNDTLKFTDATTQSSEKSPQEIMAQETANKQLAANGDEAKRAQVNGNPAALATQQANTANVQANAAPLALQQAAGAAGQVAQGTDRKSPLDSSNINTPAGPPSSGKSETVRTTDSKASLATATTEDRVKAAKAALNLQ
jgi:hypothetical protein